MRQIDVENNLKDCIIGQRKLGATDKQITEAWVNICIDRTGMYHEG